MIVAMIILLACCSCFTAQAQVDNVAGLLAKLQKPDTTDVALADIKKETIKNQQSKEIIAAKLPDLFAQTQDDGVLANESDLAGYLQLQACAPQLVALLAKGDVRGNAVTLTQMTRLADDPAGRALIAIGDPAVPSISRLLLSPDAEIRLRAARALAAIDTRVSLTALASERPHETDPYIQHFIDSHKASQ